MKKSFRIEEMPRALEALNGAIQQAMLIMLQKNVYEASASIALHIDLSNGDRPKVDYKTNIRVPIDMTEKGTAVNASQIYWDDELHSFVMEVKGEQVKLEDVEQAG